jgi:Lon protease-like protein
MFPLGSVVFPHQLLPLHVFEPRYLQMVNELLVDDGRFGAVLIERGFEVGGNDKRFSVGTLMQLVRTQLIDDARLAAVAVGVRRIRIDEWLPDDPYPRAVVSDAPDAGAPHDLAVGVGGAHAALRRVVALAGELRGTDGHRKIDLPDDPVGAMWALCGLAPLEELDRQRLLEHDDPAGRVAMLHVMLADLAAMLEAQLALE